MMASDPTPLYGWYIRGLGGIINLVERLLQEEITLGDYWFGELKRMSDQLNKVVANHAVKAR